MAQTRMSSRAFDQDTRGARRAARDGPVIITDRGHPTFVLLTSKEYERLTGPRRSILDALALPGLDHLAFDPPENKTPRLPFDFD